MLEYLDDVGLYSLLKEVLEFGSHFVLFPYFYIFYQHVIEIIT